MKSKLIKTIFILLSLMILTWPVNLPAQAPEPDKIPRAEKSLISVPVAVSDREGRYIAGLKKEDFTVYQDGVKQDISFFATVDEPLNIALLLDTSGSTQNSLEKIKDAAKDFIELLNPADKCLVATFDSQVNILNSLTSDQDLLKKSLKRVETAQQDGTLLNNAVQQLVQNSFTNVEGRKVILILSDGKDFGSSITKAQLMSQLEESDVMIYTIFYKTGVVFNKLVIAPNGVVNVVNDDKKKKKTKTAQKEKSIFSRNSCSVRSAHERRN
jgi:VWFA-related protein